MPFNDALVQREWEVESERDEGMAKEGQWKLHIQLVRMNKLRDIHMKSLATHLNCMAIVSLWSAVVYPENQLIFHIDEFEKLNVFIICVNIL